jgi:hypothetical protein
MKPYKKVTDFIKYTIEMEVKVWDLKEFEIERDGKKVMVTDGRMYVKMRGYVEFDYTGRFKTPFEQKLLSILLSVFAKYYELKHIDNVTFSLYELQKQIKEFLNMETKYYGYDGWPG